MSLTYHSEHLAWQQRVFQEKNRASRFYRTSEGFFSSPEKTGCPFPKANQDLIPSNYKSLKYNLAYTFGGSKPIKHATTEGFYKNSYSKSQTRTSDNEDNRKVRGKSENKYLKKYAEELKQRIAEERVKTKNLEKIIKSK